MQFKDIIGQQEIKAQLIQEVEQDKISHAQLFLGQSGYGGLPLALAFITYLFCENKSSSDSCGRCPSCHKIAISQHPDVHFSFPVVLQPYKNSDGALHHWREQLSESVYFTPMDWLRRIDEKERKPIIGSEESQEIVRKLSLKSYEGGYKVMVIWQAEQMNTDCANKLLKILEEPPLKTLFILVCERQDAILPTILSRTQLLKIPRIQTEELKSHFQKHTALTGAALDSILARAEGNYLAANELLGTHQELDDNRDLFIQLMRVCYKKDVIQMLDWAERAATLTKARQQIFLTYSLHMFRQSLLRNYTQDLLTKVSQEENEFLEKFSKFITGNNLFDFTQTFDEAHYNIERNANPKILFTNLCFRVMRFIHFA